MREKRFRVGYEGCTCKWCGLKIARGGIAADGAYWHKACYALERKMAAGMSCEGVRQAKYLEIITSLNKQRRVGENEIFDCGELGFIHIWWSGATWLHRWFEPSQEFKEEVKDGQG